MLSAGTSWYGGRVSIVSGGGMQTSSGAMLLSTADSGAGGVSGGGNHQPQAPLVRGEEGVAPFFFFVYSTMSDNCTE